LKNWWIFSICNSKDQGAVVVAGPTVEEIKQGGKFIPQQQFFGQY
jgi:hypothetical protein